MLLRGVVLTGVVVEALGRLFRGGSVISGEVGGARAYVTAQARAISGRVTAPTGSTTGEKCPAAPLVYF
jgi:hypothetical protein